MVISMAISIYLMLGLSKAGSHQVVEDLERGQK